MNIDIWYFWVQVSSSDHDYFAAKELAQCFSRNKNEGFKPYDGNIYHERIIDFFHNYSPNRNTEGDVSKFGIMGIGLVLCKGHYLQKAMILQDLISVGDQIGDEVKRNNNRLFATIFCIF